MKYILYKVQTTYVYFDFIFTQIFAKELYYRASEYRAVGPSILVEHSSTRCHRLKTLYHVFVKSDEAFLD